MPTIKKVLNSSVILANDGDGEDYIVLSKGIGYGRKPGQWVDVEQESKIFVPQTPSEMNNLMELLNTIPPVYLEIVRDVVKKAESTFNTSLNKHIYLALTDHIQFAIERIKNNMIITNRVFWEIKSFYAKEYGIGKYALELIQERLDISLPDEEAANIAFHIVNAQREENVQFDAMRAAKLIGMVTSIVTYTMRIEANKDSIHYSRFITHMQYFAERFFTGQTLDSEDDFLYSNMEVKYPKAIACAEKIRTLLIKEYEKMIPNEEVAYLAIHIQRLNESRR